MKKSISAYRRHDISEYAGPGCCCGRYTACAQASRLIEGIDADHLLADKAYDTGVILAQAASQGMDAVIPPKKIRKDQRCYDAELYKHCHKIRQNKLQILPRRSPNPLSCPLA